MFIEDFNKYKWFKPLNIETKDFDIVGMFPYETAGIYGSNGIRNEIAKLPRSIFHEIEELLMKNCCADNKIVVICKDKVRFNTGNFAIFLHDCSARIGSWEDVTGYAARELELKK